MSPEELRDRVATRFGEGAVEVSHGLLTLEVDHGEWVEALTYARDELGCTFFDWLNAVDDLDDGFTVVAHLWSPQQRHRLLVRTRVPRQDPRLATATVVFRGANWHERETFEMFGVTFTGHPNLEPLLLPDGFEGRPLRKDFVLASRVAKQWPGAVEAGQSSSDVSARRKKKLPAGVPDPDEWGPNARRGGDQPGDDQSGDET